MGYIRNLLIFSAIAMVVVGCGGGNTTITNSPAAASTTTAPATSNVGGTSATSTSGASSTTTTTTGSVTLKWTAPSTRADNTSISLSDISGYRLYYGSTATDTPKYVNINDGTATQYTISLPSGSYYFRISAIDSSGYEGLESTAIQKTL